MFGSLGSVPSSGFLGHVGLTLSTQSCLTLQTHRLQPARLLCPGDSPGENTGVGCHALIQGIFPAQRSSPRLLSLLPCAGFFAAEPSGNPGHVVAVLHSLRTLSMCPESLQLWFLLPTAFPQLPSCSPGDPDHTWTVGLGVRLAGPAFCWFRSSTPRHGVGRWPWDVVAPPRNLPVYLSCWYSQVLP